MNINRDYLIINDVKKSNVKLDNGSIFFYITDKNTQNIFVNLVINVSNNDLIQKYANIENAEDYTLTMNIVKPDNTYKVVEGKLHDKEKAIFEFDLEEDCVDKIGTYKCELLTKCNINDHEEITTSNKLTYKVKSSILNDLDDIVEAPEYPLVIQLFDKLSDINQYEEDRRANELARQLAEEQRQTRFNTLDADMVDRVNAMDSKMDDVEARISAKEQAVDKLIVDTKADIDDYKVAKDTEIDEYKATKDTEINNAITAQDNKIDEAITNQNNKIDDAVANQNNKIDTAVAEQNNRIGIVEASDNTQNTRLNALEAKDIAHETSITNIEAKNVEQDNRLDVAENRLDNIGEDIRNTIQPTIDAQNSRLDSIEAVNVSQDNRLDAIEIKNQQQDDRLLDIEKLNNRQDIDIKCLYGASQTIDVAKEGNSIYLQNSNNGFTIVDEIKGNTMVNCNKEPNKEIILNGNINTQGYSNVTLTEGVDGGLVDVALEGNTMVNVCDQKDPVAITKSYTVETGNHVALQGEYDGKCRPVVTGNTLWIDNNTGEVLTAFDATKNLRLQSSFEDKVVTQEMVDNGEELAENLGKYRVDYKVTGKNKFNNLPFVKQNSSHGGELINLDNGFSVTGLTNAITTFYKTYLELSKGTYAISFDINTPSSEIPINIFFQKNEVFGTNIINPKIVYESGRYNFTLTLDSDTKVAFFFDMRHTEGTITVNNIQLEEGTVATPYEPYKEYTKTFYLNSPLLEGDTIEQQGDNVAHVHRYGKVVLDGSEKWSSVRTKDNTIAFGFAKSDVKSVSPLLCDRFNNANIYSGDIECIWCNDMKTIQIQILQSKLTTQDVAGFKAWLQSNPTTVVYKLETPQYEVISQNDTILCDSYVNGHLDVDSVVPIERVVFKNKGFNLKYLYENTEYIVQFESDNNGLLDLLVIGGKSVLANQNITKGINKINITTKSVSNNSIWFTGIGFNTSNIVVTEATDQDFGYFEGMKSVGECEDLEVVSYNKNLFDGVWEYGDLKEVVGEIGGVKNNSTGIIHSDYISIKGDTYYTCKYDISNYDDGSINDFGAMFWYDKDKKLISRSTGLTLKSPLNAKYVRLRIARRNFVEIDKTSISAQLEEGNTATDYSPYTHNTQTLTHEPLRAVGDTKDKYVLIGDKWYIERNCGEIVFDGSDDEIWHKESIANYTTYRYSYELINRRGSEYTLLCNRIGWNEPYLGYGDSVNFKTITTHVNGGLLYIVSNISTIDEFKLDLQQNPITVIYQLSTPTYEPIDYNPFTVYSDTTHISNNSTIPCNMTIKNTGYNCLLKPSTTYTVSSNLGLNTVTTPSTLTEDCLRFYDTDTSTVTKMKDVTILEGDWTTKADLIPSNFSGIESAFEQELVTGKNDEYFGKYRVTTKVIGKNLFNVNGNYMDNAYIEHTTGEIKTSGKHMMYLDYITILPNTKYLFKNSSYSYGTYLKLVFYDKNKNYISGVSMNSNDICTTSPLNAKYCRVSFYKKDDYLPNIQLEKGAKATTYEPYKESIIEFYINEPLRGIGDVKDKVYVKNDKVVVERKCGSVTLDGSEDWSNLSIVKGYDTCFAYMILDNLYANNNENTLLCDKFPSIIGATYNYNNESIYAWNNGVDGSKVYIQIKVSELSSKDLNGFKQWLQQNPTTVVYQLAEPTYEEVEYHDVKLFIESFKNSTLFYNSNIPVTSKVWYSYSIPLVDTVAQTANATDEQDVMIIDLATQVAVMEMLLM